MNNIIYLIICIAVIAGCKNEIDSEIIINPDNAIDKEVYLSDFVEELVYIPIDNEVIFSGIISIDICGNYIVIGTQVEPLLRYDIEGNFINRIGSHGRGPGEYQFAHHFVMDSQCKKIFIYDNYKIITYNINGKFIRDFNITDFDGHPGQIYYRNGIIYLACQLMYGYAKYSWVVVDTLGNTLSYKFNKIPPFNSIQPGRAGFFTIKDNLHYWNDHYDTIFILHEDNSYEPAMYFAQGDFRIPYSRIASEDSWGYFKPRRLFNTKDYLIFGYAYDRHNHIALIGKTDGTIFTIDKGTSGIRGYEPGISNDIDGGLDFYPYYSFSKDGYKYLVNWYFAYRLKNYVESEAFRNATPKYPEKKKELEELAASLDENDNQILVLARLKK